MKVKRVEVYTLTSSEARFSYKSELGMVTVTISWLMINFINLISFKYDNNNNYYYG